MSPSSVLIVSTVHWVGDPRLNRHREYLTDAGHEVSLMSHRGAPRWLALARTLKDIARSKSSVVILPDPELYFLGSVAARLTGKRPVPDIHEDYPRAAMARPWVPGWARPVVRVLAAFATWLGRLAAWRVMVAAPELARRGDLVVLNVPDPLSLQPVAPDGSHRLVYIGDVTLARGALAMVETLGHLDESFVLEVIGNLSTGVASWIESAADGLGVRSRVDLIGRLEHSEAWSRAGGALAGLNLLAAVPAYMEAVATKLWEYMAIGLPVVVSDLPGQARIVSQIHPDLVCPTPLEAADMIRRLAHDPELRKALGEQARRLVEEKWEASRPDRVVQSLLEP